MRVIEQALLEKVIIERSRTSHKGDYGRLLLLGGTYPLWWCYHHGCFGGC